MNSGFKLSNLKENHLLLRKWIKRCIAFDDNTFDLVFSKEVLPHLDEKNAIKLARECIRVTKGSNIFFEIQYTDDNEGANLMKKWDNTHKTIRPKEWWIKQLEQINYPGSYHFKKLF